MAATIHPYHRRSNHDESKVKINFLTTTCKGALSTMLERPIPGFVEQNLSSEKKLAMIEALQACVLIRQKHGVHSPIKMKVGGFSYTGHNDEAYCHECELKVSGWTIEMDPFTVHAERNSNCPYVQRIRPKERLYIPITVKLTTKCSTTDDNEQPTKRLKVEIGQEAVQSNTLVEVGLLKQMRKRTFSHWPHKASPSSSQMIEAGFFNCNVGDRIICIYCNLVCQQWTPHTDDPWEVHRTLSPKCPYVITALKHQQTSSIRIVNEQTTRENVTGTTNTTTNDAFRFDEIVYTGACHPAYIDIPRRHTSFATWLPQNAPSVDDLVRAGFFYTGTKTIVTCFYCNGSLQNWGANDNPTIEHARWFPQCAYAKQLCGTELYRKIQESKRAQQERARAADSNKQTNSNNVGSSRGQLNILDESTLSRFVAARLDLPVSQNMLDKHFKLSIIKRCWEDQLRLKQDDFIDFCDLFLACLILQKQIERIDGKKENIIVPSITMNRIRENEQAAIHAREQANSASSINSSNNTDIEMSTSSDSVVVEGYHENSPTKTEDKRAKKTKLPATGPGEDSSPSDPCVLCLEEERRLACIPCGHLATCVPCGHSLRSCPICRTAIDAFVRIYL